MKKLLIALVCILLVVGVVGGTLAWLTAEADPVTNTFTTSGIDITLEETTGKTYQMIPGWTIEKDPKVTVLEGSEDCWVFIKVEENCEVTVDGEEYSLTDYITYEIDPNNWEPLPGEEGVYYCKVTDVTKDRAIKVLGYTDEAGFHPNQVLVKDTVTEAMMEALEKDGAVQPTLTFTAYATQLMKDNTNEFTAADAWAKVKP